MDDFPLSMGHSRNIANGLCPPLLSNLYNLNIFLIKNNSKSDSRETLAIGAILLNSTFYA